MIVVYIFMGLLIAWTIYSDLFPSKKPSIFQDGLDKMREEKHYHDDVE